MSLPPKWTCAGKCGMWDWTVDSGINRGVFSKHTCSLDISTKYFNVFFFVTGLFVGNQKVKSTIQTNIMVVLKYVNNKKIVIVEIVII